MFLPINQSTVLPLTMNWFQGGAEYLMTYLLLMVFLEKQAGKSEIYSLLIGILYQSGNSKIRCRIC